MVVLGVVVDACLVLRADSYAAAMAQRPCAKRLGKRVRRQGRFSDHLARVVGSIRGLLFPTMPNPFRVVVWPPVLPKFTTVSGFFE